MKWPCFEGFGGLDMMSVEESPLLERLERLERLSKYFGSGHVNSKLPLDLDTHNADDVEWKSGVCGLRSAHFACVHRRCKGACDRLS